MSNAVDIRELNELIAGKSTFVNTITMGMDRTIVGQKHLVESLLIGLLSNGHILLEGVPGLAKTLAIKTLASLIDAKYNRIQFTPDLLPADVVGTMVYSQSKEQFQIKRGPIFANFVLADEINRAPAKVQSALLEAMQERQVTIGEKTFKLDDPFLVMATQNPIEQEGTYPLPEAQVDRFMLKVVIGYPKKEEEKEIIRRNIDNPVGAFLISINGKMCDAEQLYMLLDSVPEAYRDERFNNFSKQLKEDVAKVVGAARTAEGGAYVNFELKDLNGNPVLFSTIVESNKYTLLDFWASWCGPCRNAMPAIKKIYEKYGKHGLAVVSLSLDDDAEAWKKAVADLGMTWVQLCNPDGGSREVGQAYGVEFIPTVLIIDKDGKIVSRGLEGERLAAKIDELMK